MLENETSDENDVRKIRAERRIYRIFGGVAIRRVTIKF